MFNDFIRAIGQLGDPRLSRLVVKSLLLSLGLLIAVSILLVKLIVAGAGLLAGAVGATLPAWAAGGIGWGSGLASFGLSFLLFLPVASAVTTLYLDQVAAAVEARHYPHLPKVPGLGLWAGVADAARFLVVMILANIVALVAAAILPFAAPLIFLAMNGYLMGREFFQMAALRRIVPQGAAMMRGRHGVTIWLSGMVLAVMLYVPLLGLLVPVIGAAAFTHLYHRLAGTKRAA